MPDLRDELINKIKEDYSLDGFRLVRFKDLTDDEKAIWRRLAPLAGAIIPPCFPPISDLGQADDPDRLADLPKEALNAVLRIGAAAEWGFRPPEEAVEKCIEFYGAFCESPTLFEPKRRGQPGRKDKGPLLDAMAALVLLGLTPADAANDLATPGVQDEYYAYLKRLQRDWRHEENSFPGRHAWRIFWVSSLLIHELFRRTLKVMLQLLEEDPDFKQNWEEGPGPYLLLLLHPNVPQDLREIMDLIFDIQTKTRELAPPFPTSKTP